MIHLQNIVGVLKKQHIYNVKCLVIILASYEIVEFFAVKKRMTEKFTIFFLKHLADTLCNERK